MKHDEKKTGIVTGSSDDNFRRRVHRICGRCGSRGKRGAYDGDHYKYGGYRTS